MSQRERQADGLTQLPHADTDPHHKRDEQLMQVQRWAGLAWLGLADGLTLCLTGPVVPPAPGESSVQCGRNGLNVSVSDGWSAAKLWSLKMKVEVGKVVGVGSGGWASTAGVTQQKCCKILIYKKTKKNKKKKHGVPQKDSFETVFAH